MEINKNYNEIKNNQNSETSDLSESYVYSNINPVENFEYKIRINFMIYKFNSTECLNILKTLDYNIELIDINIYTEYNLKLSNPQIPIFKMSEIDAFKDIYNYYMNYDYIWIINSSTVLIEPSILKDCLSTQKTFVSGLTIRTGTIYSNFWGEITKSGWYARSDNYLDIIERKKINTWNVPYITSNLLIHSKIFDKYNLIQDTTFFDLDMKICHNLRINNKSMYLINKKLYGYILQENQKKTILNINDDLKNNWTTDKIFSSEYLKFYYSDDMTVLNEVEKGSDIWCFPFFTPEFCDYLVEFAETIGEWSGGIYTKGTLDKRIGTVENIPTQDVHLKDLGLEPFWLKIINEHFKKIMSKLYYYKTKNYNIAFIVKYDAERGQTSLQPHHDASVYTTNIALCSDSEYEGGGVKFHSKNITLFNKNKGWLCLHPGRVTHYHEALPITKGLRYVLVSFNN